MTFLVRSDRAGKVDFPRNYIDIHDTVISVSYGSLRERYVVHAWGGAECNAFTIRPGDGRHSSGYLK